MELAEHVATPPSLETTPKQDAFLDAVFSGDYRIFALGGAIRGTKTFTVLIALAVLMRVFPRSRWAIVRSDLPTLRRNTVPSVNKLRDTMGGWLGELNQSTWTYTAANGSELILFPESFDTDPDLDRWKGLEVNGFLLEEGNELRRKSYLKAIERAGAWIIPPTPEQRAAGEAPEQPPPFLFVTFNPSDEWTDEEFHEPAELGTLRAPKYFLPLRITDNPYLTADYRASLETLREASPEDYARFVEGKRGSVTEPNQLIPSDWIIRAINDVAPLPGALREGVDVADYGDDDSVFAALDGNTLVDLEGHNGLGVTGTADRAAARIVARGVPSENVAVDSVGVGAGTAGNLTAAGIAVRRFVAGASPVPRPGSFYQFKNLRSQAWWEAREKLRRGEVAIRLPKTPAAAAALRRLTKDLRAPHFTVGGDKTIEVESTDRIKKRTGHSPDYGTAFVQALFDFPPVRTARPARSVSMVSLR